MDTNKVFKYHAPHDDQPARYVTIRETAKALADCIMENVPDSREKSLALTAVQQSVMWANAGIAITESTD